VYYKFKSGSSKAWDTVCFDGACINLLDLKRAIVKHKHLDKGNDDFDLLVSHSQTDERNCSCVKKYIKINLFFFFNQSIEKMDL
jgi:hypothetical protein